MGGGYGYDISTVISKVPNILWEAGHSYNVVDLGFHYRLRTDRLQLAN